LTCIALSGYYGFYNTGDEAILEAIIGIVRRRLPGAELVVFSADPDHTRQEYGVESVSRTCLFSIFRTLHRADLLISGGGGLLQDVTSLRSVAYYLGMIELAFFMGKKVAVFAQGMGPLHHPLARRWVKRVLNKVDLISVRDPLSAAFLEELGVGREIRVAADPVFTLSPASPQEIETFWARHKMANAGRQQPHIGIALRFFPREQDSGEEIFEMLTRACIYLVQRYNARLVFLPYHLSRDLPLARQIASGLSQQSLVIDCPLSNKENMCLVGGLDMLVGMRLHALIFAAVSGIPFLALPYDPKVNAFLGRLGKNPLPPLQEMTLERLKKDLDIVLAEGKKNFTIGLRAKIRELEGEVEKAAGELLSLVEN
jgi:polysaccharide pyruvyl transferase CsaB